MVRAALLPQADGWLRWQPDPAPGVQVLVKLIESPGGRMEIAGLRFDGPVNSEVLRALPLGRIEACANAQVGGWSTDGASVGDEAPSTRPRLQVVPGSAAGWEAPLPTGSPDAAAAAAASAPRRGRPDSFYADIAREYGELVAASSRPAADLAERHEVPTSTAHRWIKEARRRHLLRPGQPGKAG